jgi:hypothetical protein
MQNSEKNRAHFHFDLKTIEFCPNFANFAQNQGVNSEFCGFLPKRQSTNELLPLPRRFKKLTGNEQGSLPPG